MNLRIYLRLMAKKLPFGLDKEMAKRLDAVQDTIEKEKQAALDSIKRGVASLSVEIAADFI